MPTTQAAMSTSTGTTRSQTRPFGFAARNVSDGFWPLPSVKRSPLRALSSCRRIGPKSNLKMATKNIVTIVKMA